MFKKLTIAIIFLLVPTTKVLATGLDWGEHNGRFSCTIENMSMSLFEDGEFEYYTGYQDGPKIGESIDLLFGVGINPFDNVAFYAYMGYPKYNKTRFMLPYYEIDIIRGTSYWTGNFSDSEPYISISDVNSNLTFSTKRLEIWDSMNQDYLLLKKNAEYESRWNGYYFKKDLDNSNLITLSCYNPSPVFSHIYNYYKKLK